MALLHETATFGDSLKGTDEFGGCISYGQTSTAMDSDFDTQQITLGFGFQLEVAAGVINTCRWGMDDAIPVVDNGKRFYIEVTSDAGNLNINCILDTTACGFQIVASHSIVRDTTGHKVGWSYNAAGSWFLVLDGAQVGTGAATCADISGPFAATDTMTIWSSTAPGDDAAFWVGQAYFHNAALTSAQMITLQTGGLP